MMETRDWLELVAKLRKARKLIEKGRGLKHEGYQHRLKWGKAAYEMARLELALGDLLAYEYPDAFDRGIWLGSE